MINTLDTGPIADGSYYVMAILDTNGNGAFDPLQESRINDTLEDAPMSIYGGATPVAIDLSGGKDEPNASITLLDPVLAAKVRSIPWPDAPRSALLQRIEAMLKAQPRICAGVDDR